MKFRTLPVKRVPENKGLLRRLSAVTGNRRQRAAAAAPMADMDMDETGSKISRALTVIFLVHIVVIGLIFFHQKYMAERTPESTENEVLATPAAASTRTNLPKVPPGEKPYFVQHGDNYQRIAKTLEVDERDLRAINQDVDITQGLMLRIPPKRIVAEDPPEVTAIRAKTPVDEETGLVDAVDVTNAPKALTVKSSLAAKVNSENARDTEEISKSGKSHVVQRGETISKIATRYKVSQKALERANKITDPKKMRVGTKLVIPVS